MSNSSIIVDKYAKTAFRIAKENNNFEVFLKDLHSFSNNISPFLKELLNPVISKSQIEKIINDLSKKLILNPQTEKFLITLSQLRRLSLLKKIQKKLEDLIKKEQNIIQVTVTSAKKLDTKQISEIKQLICKKHPENKGVEIHETIKKDIIGGIILKVDSYIVDNSIKNQLSNLYAECTALT